MTFFSAYHVTHAWCEKNKLLKVSFICISGNEYFKYVIDGKDCMKPSVKAREKNYLKANKFWTTFAVFELCANFSGSAVLLLVEFRTD